MQNEECEMDITETLQREKVVIAAVGFNIFVLLFIHSFTFRQPDALRPSYTSTKHARIRTWNIGTKFGELPICFVSGDYVLDLFLRSETWTLRCFMWFAKHPKHKKYAQHPNSCFAKHVSSSDSDMFRGRKLGLYCFRSQCVDIKSLSRSRRQAWCCVRLDRYLLSIIFTFFFHCWRFSQVTVVNNNIFFHFSQIPRQNVAAPNRIAWSCLLIRLLGFYFCFLFILNQTSLIVFSPLNANWSDDHWRW